MSLKTDYDISHNYLDYLEQFFVGLLEADGTITTGMTSKLSKPQTARVRIVIALKRNPENIAMLNLFQKYICGKVVLEKKKSYHYVVWISQTAKDIHIVSSIFKKYPFITTRKQSQWNFANLCMNNKYLYIDFCELRNKKYDNKLEMLKLMGNKAIPSYFSGWLSGFIEGEGNFSLVFNDKKQLRKSAFAIGQNDEVHILDWIKTYFNGETKILVDKPKKDGNFSYYRLYLYNEKTRFYIFNHFNVYPLLGEKRISYLKFYNHHNKSV